MPSIVTGELTAPVPGRRSCSALRGGGAGLTNRVAGYAGEVRGHPSMFTRRPWASKSSKETWAETNRPSSPRTVPLMDRLPVEQAAGSTTPVGVTGGACAASAA